MIGRISHSVRFFWAIGCVFWCVCTPTASAVIIVGSGDPSANTTAPTGFYADSGWDYLGDFGGFLGTAISPTQFITARHVGTNSTFTYQGQTFPVQTTAGSYWNVPNTDLRIFQLASGSFDTWAELYTGDLTVGTEFVIFGKGAQRGEEIAGKGWYNGTTGFARRWGTNTVTTIQNYTGLGEVAIATFDLAGGYHEAYATTGDSGGSVFVYDILDDTWKLAGITYGNSGFYNTSPTDTGSQTWALYDSSGLYRKQANGTWAASIGPSATFISNVSADSTIEYIQGILITPVPEPGSGLLIGVTLGAALLRRRRV